MLLSNVLAPSQLAYSVSGSVPLIRDNTVAVQWGWPSSHHSRHMWHRAVAGDPACTPWAKAVMDPTTHKKYKYGCGIQTYINDVQSQNNIVSSKGLYRSQLIARMCVCVCAMRCIVQIWGFPHIPLLITEWGHQYDYDPRWHMAMTGRAFCLTGCSHGPVDSIGIYFTQYLRFIMHSTLAKIP